MKVVLIKNEVIVARMPQFARLCCCVYSARPNIDFTRPIDEKTNLSPRTESSFRSSVRYC